MFNALHYYWIAAKGYRLRPWQSPYIRWRMETFLGPEAAPLSPGFFFISYGASARACANLCTGPANIGA